MGRADRGEDTAELAYDDPPCQKLRVKKTIWPVLGSGFRVMVRALGPE